MLQKNFKILLLNQVTALAIYSFKETGPQKKFLGNRFCSFCSCRPHAGIEETKNESRCSASTQAGLSENIFVHAPIKAAGSSSCNFFQLVSFVVTEIDDNTAPLSHAVVEDMAVRGCQDQHERLNIQSDG